MLLPDLNFATLKALKPVEIVINEASRALKDQNRVISSSEIANVLRVTRQITNEEDIFFRAIYAYGTGKSSNPGKSVRANQAIPENMSRLRMSAAPLWVSTCHFWHQLLLRGY